MSEELEPCPFCGKPPKVSENPLTLGLVSCGNTGCCNETFAYPEEWNTRPVEDALHARIAELEQGWIPNEPDSWNFCPYPCEVRYDANGKPTHHRQLPPEDK